MMYDVLKRTHPALNQIDRFLPSNQALHQFVDRREEEQRCAHLQRWGRGIGGSGEAAGGGSQGEMKVEKEKRGVDKKAG